MKYTIHITTMLFCTAAFIFGSCNSTIAPEKLDGVWQERFPEIDMTGIKPHIGITFFGEDSLTIGTVRRGKIYDAHSGRYTFTKETRLLTGFRDTTNQANVILGYRDTSLLVDFELIRLTDKYLTVYDRKRNKELRFSRYPYPYPEGTQTDLYNNDPSMPEVVIKARK